MGEEVTSTSFHVSETNAEKSMKGSIKNKLRNYLLLFSAQSILIIGAILFFTMRSNYIKDATQRLQAVNVTVKDQLENKLEVLQDHVRVLSANQTVVDAMENLRYQFRLVNADTTLIFSDNEFENAVINLKSYYNAHFLAPLNEKLLTNHTVEEYFPEDRRTRLLQHLYISGNPNPPGEKHLLDKGLDFSEFSKTHLAYHPFLRHVVENYDLKDLFLIDNESGYIVYSTAKNVDFGTSLISGPFRDTKLALAYKQAAESNSRDMAVISDVEYSHPAGAYPVFYVSSPVFQGAKKIGVLALEISLDEMEKIVSLDDEDDILGKTGENLIVGKDFRVRNNVRSFVTNPDAFEKALRKENIDKDIIQKMHAVGSTALLYSVNSDAAMKALQGESGQETTVSTDGNSNFVVYSPIETAGLSWALLTLQTKSEIAGNINKVLIIAIISSLLLLIVVYFASSRISNSIFNRLEIIRNGISRLSKGETLQNENYYEQQKKTDELGSTLNALRILNTRIDGASEFARKLGKNDFEATYAPVSENDQLGISLNEMKNSLVQAKEDQEVRNLEDKKRNWSTQGIAKFSDILRLNNDNIEALSYTVVSNLVEYLNANQAGIFVTNDEDGEKELELSAAFAFDRRKYISRKVQFGEGLVGACAIEKKTMYMKEVPDNYIHITSGLGEANPKSLLIVPMIVENEVLGVIEIASFNEFEHHEIEFVEKIAETIGSTIVTTKVNARTAKLLEESKVRAEEMAAQEEEMRQNMEELQATQEEMRRIKDEEARKEHERRESEEKIMQKLKEQNEDLKRDEEILHQQKEELEKEKSLMDALMISIPEHIYFKDKDSKFIRFSNSMLTLFGLRSKEELLGKSDFDFFSEEHARPAFEDEQNIIKTGQPVIDKIEMEKFEDGTVNWVNTSKLPLKDAEGNIIGTFGISKNITHLKELEIEAEKKTERIEALEEEIANLKKTSTKDGKDKTIKKLEKELQSKNKELDRIREETAKTRNQIDALRGKKKK